MSSFYFAIDVLQTLVIALGAGLAIGARSTFWTGVEMIIRERMRSAHKEATTKASKVR